ncbi:MAG: elongation factor G [Chloroflexi bacterium]|nr:elongation factor G [Chloroflexota bacterium]MCI0816984.1 elongation factor G [Chloroflexota bacterium]MCI0883977.1 elongation factor G [Chloroflexota bacterium]
MSESVPVERVRNIGIIAHIDAGKTTVTERILFHTGITYKIGDVDAGTAVMDWMAQERERGITITAAATTTTWNDHQINIVDTPGHVDFTVEVERSLRVLDGGVVVFDAVAGVQSQSETVWRQADRYHIPRICFVNKMDRVGADFWAAIESIRERLNARPLAVQMPIGHEDKHEGAIDLVEMVAYTFPDGALEVTVGEIPADLKEEAARRREDLIEAIGEVDDQMLISFVEQHEVTAVELKKAIRRATITGLVNPVLCGSALKNKGVQPMLDAVIDYLPSPVEVAAITGTDPATGELIEREPDPDAPFAALAFKIVADPYVGRLVYFRVYSGMVKQGGVVINSSRGQKERLGRILRMHSNRREELTEISAGQIAATVALKNTFTGDTLCDQKNQILLEAIKFPEPVIAVAIEPKTKEDQERMGDALVRLVEEDPTFHARYDDETGQTIISGMGELHLEIIVDRMLREFNVQADVGRPEVAYKETIRDAADAEGRFVRQTGGRGQFGVVKLHVEPLEKGSGIEFENKIVGGAVPREFVSAVEHGVREALETGVKAGYPVVDVRVELVDGQHHPVDSSELAFKMAGSLAIQEAMKRGRPVLLEPVMKVEVATPDEFFGEVLSDASSRRGQVSDVDHRGHLRVISAHVPLAETFGYATTLRSVTQGRASYTMEFDHYSEVPASIAEQVSGRMQGAVRR